MKAIRKRLDTQAMNLLDTLKGSETDEVFALVVHAGDPLETPTGAVLVVSGGPTLPELVRVMERARKRHGEKWRDTSAKPKPKRRRA